MKCVMALIFALFIAGCQVVEAANQVGINPVPESGDTFLSGLQTHLREEAPGRDAERFPAFVVSGGISATDSDLVQNVSAAVVYAHGYRVAQDLTALTYTNTRRTYVFVDSASTRVSEITAVGGSGCTFLARSTRLIQIECAANSTEPTLSVAGLAPLFYADTSAGAISAIVDLRQRSVIPTIDLRNFAGDDFCLRMRAAVAVLPSGIGGTIDATGLIGPHYCSVDPFNGVPRVHLILGATRITTATQWLITSNSSITGTHNSVLTAVDNFGHQVLIKNATADPLSELARDTNIHISGFTIYGNGTNNSTGTEFSHAIMLVAVNVASVKDMVIEDMLKGDGIYIGGTNAGIKPERVDVSDNVISSTKRNCVSVTLGTIINVRDNTLTACGLVGIDVEPDLALSPNVDGMVIEGNLIFSPGQTYNTISGGGIFVVGASGHTQNISIVNNVIFNVLSTTFGTGMAFRSCVDCLVDSNQIIGSAGAGIIQLSAGAVPNTRMVIRNNKIRSTTRAGISFALTEPIVINNNDVVSSIGNGIQVDSSVGCMVSGNRVLSGSAEGIILQGASNCIVSGNHISGNALRGIRLISLGAANPTDNLIVGNYVENNVSNGIREDASADQNFIFGNKVRANASAGEIVRLGANTVVRHNKGWNTEGSGIGIVLNGATTGVVTHNLSVTPAAKDCSVTFTNAPTLPTTVNWLGPFTSTQFTLNVNNPGVSNLDFAWRCDIR